MIKKAVTGMVSVVITVLISSGMTALAGEWRMQEGKWRYENTDGTRMHDGWQWIDGNGDGVAECYYFDGSGYLLVSATTPDGYTVNQDGAWVSGGVVQVKNVAGDSLVYAEPVIADVQVVNDVLDHIFYGRLIVTLSDGTVLTQDFPPSGGLGDYIDAEVGDVTGDGEKEIVVSRTAVGNAGYTDNFIYQIRGGQLREHSVIENCWGQIKGNDFEVSQPLWTDSGKKYFEPRILHWNGSDWVQQPGGSGRNFEFRILPRNGNVWTF